ncbi:class I SAM-dependent methyltransferase [Lacinutrix undariae]
MSDHKPRTKTPWPTEAAMSQVYDQHLWGGAASDFYSGDGSHTPEIVQPYITEVHAFLTSFEKDLTVCDLGCGDFNVGRSLVDASAHYIAVDIVPALIARNKKIFMMPQLEFQCLDIAVTALPAGDCVLIRQVLQHLSNAEIQRIVLKLQAYQYVVLTEHVPEGNFTPNIDIISGQGTRLKKNSGVDLLQAPFHLKVKSARTVLSIPLGLGRGEIVTTIYQLF